MPKNTVVIPMSREQFEAEREKAAAAGFPLVGDSGSVERIKVPFGEMGLKFSYDGTALYVTVTHKPMMLPESAVESEIKKDLAV